MHMYVDVSLLIWIYVIPKASSRVLFPHCGAARLDLRLSKGSIESVEANDVLDDDDDDDDDDGSRWS